MIFKNREQAWKLLWEYIKRIFKVDDPNKWLVLAIPRWWIPIAWRVSKILNIPMDILVVKKLAPLAFPEYWFWAMDPDGNVLIDTVYMRSLWVDDQQLAMIQSKTINEIARKLEKYAKWKLPDVNWKNVIIVDDGVATGFTVAVAANWAKRHGANKVILAVPVCPADIDLKLNRFFDQIICLSPQQNFQAVWQFYEDFHQVDDEEIKKYREI